jgi:hypothetical protein
LAGFTSGEGCFHVSLKSTPRSKLGKKVGLTFVFGLHIRKELIIIYITSYFNMVITQEKKGLGCDNCYKISKYANSFIYYTKDKKVVRFHVNNFSVIQEIIIPFFLKYPIEGKKRLDLLDFIKSGEIIKKKEQLTEKGLIKIIQIREGMNSKRK